MAKYVTLSMAYLFLPKWQNFATLVLVVVLWLISLPELRRFELLSHWSLKYQFCKNGHWPLKDSNFVSISKNGPLLASFSLFSSFQQLTNSTKTTSLKLLSIYLTLNCQLTEIKNCHWLDSNSWSLVPEAIVLPKVSQPPILHFCLAYTFHCNSLLNVAFLLVQRCKVMYVLSHKQCDQMLEYKVQQMFPNA